MFFFFCLFYIGVGLFEFVMVEGLVDGCLLWGIIKIRCLKLLLSLVIIILLCFFILVFFGNYYV